MRGIDARDVDSAFAEWSSRLERCTAEPVPARRLYAGDHWSVVQYLEDVAAASKLDSAIWVCSAGYGLIGIDTNIKPYSATFSSRHLDTGADGIDILIQVQMTAVLGGNASKHGVVPSLRCLVPSPKSQRWTPDRQC